MLLLDTNVWLELLLVQAKAEEVRQLLQDVESSDCALTDFSLHSIGIILTRLKKHDLFMEFLFDTLQDSEVRMIRLDSAGLAEVPTICRRFGLDFDDAYQYVAAEKFNLTLVSFDADFDRTERGRRIPPNIF
jgi:uncharacterized protein